MGVGQNRGYTDPPGRDLQLLPGGFKIFPERSGGLRFNHHVELFLRQHFVIQQLPQYGVGSRCWCSRSSRQLILSALRSVGG